MTAPPQMTNGNGQPGLPQQPTLPNGTVLEDPMLGVNAMLRIVRIAAENAAGQKSSEEAKDWADTALKFAQAIVILDPSLSQGGTPLQHDVAMKTLDGQTQQAVAQIQGETQVRTEQVRGENAIRQARMQAQAPTPAKSLTVRRDQAGRLSGIEQEG